MIMPIAAVWCTCMAGHPHLAQAPRGRRQCVEHRADLKLIDAMSASEPPWNTKHDLPQLFTLCSCCAAAARVTTPAYMCPKPCKHH